MMQQQPGCVADGIEIASRSIGKIDSVCAATQSRLALGRLCALVGTAAVGTALCGSK